MHCCGISIHPLKGSSSLTGIVPLPSFNSHWENSPSPSRTLIFSVKVNFCTHCHCKEHFIHDSTTSAGRPLFTTGNICLKSPPKRMTFPPNGKLLLQTSFNNLSIAFKACLGIMDVSSSINKLTCLKNCPWIEFGVTLHVLLSSIGTGSLNKPCNVDPFVSRVAAMPVHAAVADLTPLLLASAIK